MYHDDGDLLLLHISYIIIMGKSVVMVMVDGDGDGADCRLPIAIADCYAMPPPVISTWRFAQGDLDARQTKDPLVPTPDRRKLSKDTLQLVLTLDRRKIR